ncbi:MAG: TIGR03032 family protein [Caldilineaceae bacterium]|nr:TIGR03032 family protein [Caldilineaceae bacterium]
MNPSTEADVVNDVPFQLLASRHFPTWLAEQRISLAFTHPPQKLFLIGLKSDGSLSIFERTFLRCLGIAAPNTETIYVSSRFQVWRLDNALRPGQLAEGQYDRQYIPRKVYTTGSLGIHDVAVDADGRVIFVNTRFGMLATISEDHSFTPLWRPAHLDRLPPNAPGDRCHLNGLAMRDGRPAYVTSVSQTDEFDSWREQRNGGGVIIDVQTDEVVATGLAMPHSPRWYRGRLWVTNSGTGHFGYIDFQRGRFVPVAFGPGFLRGLCFVGDYAIVGSSKPREGDIYSGLGLSEELQRRREQARLGLFVIDLRSGNIVHWLFIESNLREIYDVVALPQVRQPMAIGLLTDEIENTLAYEPTIQAGL